jgi:hypothetical protein
MGARNPSPQNFGKVKIGGNITNIRKNEAIHVTGCGDL